MPTLELSAPQYDFVYLEKKFKAYVAGFRAGKTWAGCSDMLRHFCMFPKVPQGYFAPSYPLIRDIFYPTIEECAYQWGFRVEVRQANKEVHFFRGRRYYGTTICRSMDNPSSIIGFKIGKALVDELDVLDSIKAEHAWNKIIARLSWKQSGVLNGVSVTTTPEGFKFTYNRFFKDPKPMYGMIKASTYSNAHNLPDDYISSLIETYPPHLINAYLNGEFVNLTSGAVYPDFSRIENHTNEEIEYGEPLHIGVDFNVYNCTAMIGVIRNKQPRFLDELTGLRDTPALIDAIKERYPLSHISVYPDASGKAAKSVNASLSDIQLLRDAGFTVIADDSNPRVKDRVMAMNGVILNGSGERKLLVNTKKCPVLTECLEQQVYDKNGEPDKTESKDHACFTADTIIQTLEQGLIRFDQINEKGYVLSPNGKWVFYENAGIKKQSNQFVIIKFSNGYMVKCTPEHKFLCKGGKWIQARNLENKECVFYQEQDSNFLVIHIIYAAVIFRTAGLLVKKGLIGLFGNTLMEKLKKDLIFIIKTIINQITILRIWNASSLLSIKAFMGYRELMNYEKECLASENTQAYGINQNQGKNGIKSIMSNSSIYFMRHLKLNVAIAGKILRNQYLAKLMSFIIVQKNVKQQAEENLEWITWKKFANNAINLFTRTNTRTERVVSIVEVVNNTHEPVYCLTVPKHGCFKLTNDSPVVSNCDAAGYMIYKRFPIIKSSIIKVRLGGH